MEFTHFRLKNHRNPQVLLRTIERLQFDHDRDDGRLIFDYPIKF